MFTTLDLTLIGVLEGGVDGDDPAWTQHLQFQIGVVGDSHELRVAWTSQDGVVGSVEPDHLEGKGLCPVIGRIPKGDGQIDLPKWHGLFSWHDAVERCLGQPDACSVDTHGVKSFSIHDVEAATSIHQYFGESLWADDWADHKRISFRVWTVSRWSVRSKVMVDSDHRMKGGAAGWAV